MGLPERVAVTGGAGFIGSHTVERLVAAGCRVLIIDDLSHACEWQVPRGADLLIADCGSSEAAEALGRFRPGAGLHLACRGGVQRARRDPGGFVRSSVASSVAAFRALALAGARRIVTASSGGAVYGQPRRLPASERTPPAPLSAYGASKLAEEGYLAAIGREYGVTTLALRYGNVYGERQDGTGEAGVVAISCTRLAGGRRPSINGDGEQTRDFVYVGDVAAANMAALASERSGVANIGTGRETSVGHLVQTLIALAGGDQDPERRPGLGGEVRRVCLDPGRARRWLGWEAGTSLEQGLERTLAHFKERVAPVPGASA